MKKITPDWRPSPMAYEMLAQHLVPSDFIDDQVVSFVVYWSERNQAVFPLLSQARFVISWQGIRREESRLRSTYSHSEPIEPDATRVFAYRPILDWTAYDVFELHRKHGVKWNPLYEHGLGRVGCMLCINARKEEINQVAKRFPDIIERISLWENMVSLASKRGSATFFCATNDPTVHKNHDIHHSTHGIRRIVDWASTGRGGREYDLLATDTMPEKCQSIYGLC